MFGPYLITGLALRGSAGLHNDHRVNQEKGGKIVNKKTNVAWKCKECGEVTYHPDADMKAKIEIRTGTVCLKCLKEGG